MALLPVTGLVFAGGKSSRMGTDKALLSWEGTPLVLHVGHRLSQRVAEVLVLTGSRTLPDLPWRQVPDPVPDLGPLGGLAAGLRAAAQPWCMAVAVDMPHLAPELPELLFAHASAADLVVPIPFDRPEPLCALYGQKCLPIVESLLLAGERRMTAIFAGLRVRYVHRTELAGLGNLETIFANYNTPADWQQLSRYTP